MNSPTRKKNIIFLVKGDSFGGAERIALDIAVRLKESFNTVSILSANNHLEQICKTCEIFHYKFPINYFNSIIGYVFLCFKLFSICKNQKIEVIQYFHRIYQPIITILQFILRVKTIYSAVNIFNDIKGFLTRADYYTALSHKIYANLIDFYKINPKKIRLIYHGIDMDSIKKIQPRLIKAGEDIVIGYAGRFVKEKGIGILLEGMNDLVFSNYKLIIKGEGPLEKYIESFISKRDLSSKVKMEAWESTLDTFWQNIDILVLPSVYEEGLGLILIEGMAHGKIIVASDIGAISEILIHNHNGYLFTPNSPEKLAEIINTIYKNGVPELIISNALITATNFDLRNSIKEYLEFYENYKLV